MSNEMSIEAKELVLYIENDGFLYEKALLPAIKNASRKKAAGTYEKEKAVLLFKHVVEKGGKKYAKDFGGEWWRIFPKEVRLEVAEYLRDSFEAEYELGTYDEYKPMKYRTK